MMMKLQCVINTPLALGAPNLIAKILFQTGFPNMSMYMPALFKD